MLTTIFLLFVFSFFLGTESDDDESDESDDDGSGSRFTLGPCFSLCVEPFLIGSFACCLVESFLIEYQYS